MLLRVNWNWGLEGVRGHWLHGVVLLLLRLGVLMLHRRVLLLLLVLHLVLIDELLLLEYHLLVLSHGHLLLVGSLLHQLSMLILGLPF